MPTSASGVSSRLRVVGHLLLEQMMIDRDLARRGHQQGVTVGRRLRDRVGGDHRAGAGAVLDDDRLSERRFHRLAQQPRHDVDAAAGGIADKDADRMVGICRLCAGGEHRACSRGRRGLARKVVCSAWSPPEFSKCAPLTFSLRMILSENRFPSPIKSWTSFSGSCANRHLRGSAARRRAPCPRGNRSRCPATLR